jgi:xanthine/CO dehydrogenase XdhC/CoxF family maturation factor
LKPDVLRLAAELSGRGEPFVLATVVWRRAPSSGKEGATALITPDRMVRGWLGGACAEPTVVREALKALEEGSPRLLFLGPPDELEGRAREGDALFIVRLLQRNSGNDGVDGQAEGSKARGVAACRLDGRRRQRDYVRDGVAGTKEHDLPDRLARLTTAGVVKLRTRAGRAETAVAADNGIVRRALGHGVAS